MRRNSVPNHKVVIKVITGASAGSITGALGAAALAGGLQPTPYSTPPASPASPPQPYLYTMPALYTAWVLMPDMAQTNERSDLLATSDLKGDAPVVSLLNASLLDDIGDAALRQVRAPLGKPPLYGPLRGGKPVPYVAEPLHLYMTISNLRGVPYQISFRDGTTVKGHGMLNHGDRAHFVLNGVGATHRPSAWADSDRHTEIAVTDLPVGGAAMPAKWQAYLQAALASSAFPIGLAPRQLDATTADYHDRQWPFPRDTAHIIDPKWPEAWKSPPDSFSYSFVNVDGGMINNEPFEFTHFALMEDGTKPNPRDAKTADRAVILIDPFPEDPAFEADNTRQDRSLVGVVKALLPTFISQARFKPIELALALDEGVFSRFLIAPRRADANGQPMDFAIATGLLGGFGGFLDQSLREFDYQLGRRNCQQFLRTAFALHPDNPLIKGSDDGSVRGWSDAAKANPRFRAPDKGIDFCAVIPLVGSAAAEVTLPPWPKLPASRLAVIEQRVGERAKALVPRLIDQQIGNRILRTGAKLAWSWLGVDAVTEYVQLTIQKDLIRRDQHADWALATQEVRNIVAGLSDPAFDYRTVAGLATATGLAQDKVTATLVMLKSQGRVYVAEGAGPNGADGYTLISRKPGWFARSVGTLKSPTFDVKS